MLRFFTRLEKTRNLVLFVFAILMAGSLIFFYTPARNTFETSDLSQSQEVAARVAGEPITVADIIREREKFSQFSRGTFPAKMVLDSLINRRIMRVEAARLGLTATDREVADEIRKQSANPDGTPFDQKKYEEAVIGQYGTIAAFEQSVRDDISARKLQAYITAGVTVSEAEVLNEYQKRNAKFNISYVSLNPTEIAKTLKPSDDELKAYFEKNKASYYINEPQKKIKYVFINTEKIGQKLAISDADLKAEWDALAPDKKTMGVDGQEIVLRVPKPDDEAQIQGKATELVTQLRSKGGPITEEAFAALAKGQSENPATAGNGGKLSGPVRENPAKPDDPYQQLLKLEPGQITDPILYQGRYFILRRGETVPKTFEQAKKELEVSLRNRKAYAAALEFAKKVDDALKQSKDPAKTAADFASQANMTAGEMVKETGYVKPGDDIPDIGISSQFEEGIKGLENVNDVGDVVPVQNGFALPMLVDKKEPRDAEFAEVRAQVESAYKLEKAQSQVEEIAKAISSGAKDAASLAAAATSKGVTAKTKDDYVIGTPVGEGPSAASGQALSDAIFALGNGQVMKEPLKVGDNWVIVGVTQRKEADSNAFASQRSSLMEQMLGMKRSNVFGDYIAAAKQRLEAAGKIDINKAILEKIDAPTAQDLTE